VVEAAEEGKWVGVAEQIKPNLILLDQGMFKGLTGMGEKSLKDFEPLCSIPILLLTQFNDIIEQDQWPKNIVGHLSKSIEAEGLLNAVREQLS